jgi:isocitrate/isopropylmalate dehydrogenase
MTTYNLLLLPGDGIGPEVMAEARRQAAVADMEGRIQTRTGVAIVLTVWAIGAVLLAILA